MTMFLTIQSYSSLIVDEYSSCGVLNSSVAMPLKQSSSPSVANQPVSWRSTHRAIPLSHHFTSLISPSSHESSI